MLLFLACTIILWKNAALNLLGVVGATWFWLVRVNINFFVWMCKVQLCILPLRQTNYFGCLPIFRCYPWVLAVFGTSGTGELTSV
jgi:hypothetical protein